MTWLPSTDELDRTDIQLIPIVLPTMTDNTDADDCTASNFTFRDALLTIFLAGITSIALEVLIFGTDDLDDIDDDDFIVGDGRFGIYRR